MKTALDKCIKRFIDGDSSAFDEIYAATRKSVYYVALSVLGDGALAEDVMQTTYMKALQNIKSYKLGSNAAAWIVKIAKNEALNVRKTNMRIVTADERDSPELFGASAPDEYGELIDAAKRMLPEDEFTILMLVTVSGYKRREVGKMLDMPVPTVTWKYNNALTKMRKALSV